MNIVIAGAGEVGRHVATVLAGQGHTITLIDTLSSKLEMIGENLDARTLTGSATRADTLQEAGAARADLFIAATNTDEINLLAASIAKGLGAAKVIARVHHSAYHRGLGINYGKHFQIDQLICPEHLTSLAIAGVLRDPALHAIEHFARGRIVMEKIEVSARAEILERPLRALGLPDGIRLGTVERNGQTLVPTAETILLPGDQVSLVGMTGDLDKVLPKFRKGELARRNIVILGGSATTVWLTRALDPRFFRIRIYLTDRRRAEELSEKLPHATVFDADPTDPDVFQEEHIGEADAFVALTDDDENNILGALQAKHLGVRVVIASINRSTYHDLIEGLGIDRVFSPRIVAARQIQRLCQRQPIQEIAALDEHGTAVYEIDVSPKATAVGMSVRQLPLPQGCVLVAIQRDDDVRVPGSRDVIEAKDAIVAIAHDDLVPKLKRLFT
jgi:trk system potassium uptake protein TrkA